MSDSVLEAALSGLRDPDKKVRAGATASLILIGRDAVPYLIELTNDENWVIRYRVAEALGGIRDPGTIDSLLHLTADQKDHVRYMATKSLSQMHDSRVIPALVRMLSDEHSYTRKIAAAGLDSAGIRDPMVLSALQTACDCEPDPDVKASLQEVIVKLKK